MTVEAPAKVNLTLEVFGKRSDGYHGLRSVVMPISLSDEVSVSPADALSSDAAFPDDLCLRAARALDPSRGAAIRVVKRIPVGGGLGGGSADAAAVLRALNVLWALGKSRAELAEIGSRVGSDVPALVLGGPVLMEGRGERVTRLDGCGAPLHFVLVNPNVFSSTREVYAACRPRKADSPSPTAAMIAALRAHDFDSLVAALANDLQESAIRLHPEIGRVLDALKAAGAEAALMSGSGSTVFAPCRSAEAASRLARSVAKSGLQTWVATSAETP